jgi:arylsulfatase A-like enzyme
VVFIGDNGAAQLRGKGTLYEFGVRVPLLVRWPGRVKPGGATTELISGEDLAPTFLAAAGVPVPRTMTGRSFLPLLRGQPLVGRTHAFAERGAHGSGLPTGAAPFDLGRVVIGKTHKLIYLAGTPATETIEGELKAALQEWMILERDFLPLPLPPGASGPARAGRMPRARAARR